MCAWYVTDLTYLSCLNKNVSFGNSGAGVSSSHYIYYVNK